MSCWWSFGLRQRSFRGLHTRLRRDLGLGGPGTPGLIEIVFRYGFRLGGIEVGGLVEVVGGGFLDDLVVFPTVAPHGEFGLRRPPGGVNQRGRGGFSDEGENL